MRVLFSALHLAYFRNFESAIRELAARGHQVHLSADEVEAPVSMGGQQLADSLAAQYPAVSWDLAPSLDEEGWFDAARRLRLGLDYVRVLEPRYASAPKLRIRAHERTPRVVRWVAGVPVVGRPLARAALTGIERTLPASERLKDYLRVHKPDVVVLVSLTYSRSQQFDLLKATQELGIPVAAAIMSWDHLSSKALLHLPPDRVIVWNDVQRQEAVDMHGLPEDRIVATGAQCYDQWFSRAPERSREEFCAAMGLRTDRPFVLWVHSALSPTPDPPEPVLVTRWLDALRSSSNPALRELGVLVRPHPERLKEWTGVDLSRFDNVVFHGRNPIDADAKHDYFDALFYSRAVIGLVTSAFLEAAVVGRPVLTFTLPEYRLHQEEMLHFRYLTSVAGGLLRTAPDIAAHLAQLADVIAAPPETRDERNRRFLSAFVRPAGLDVPATPAFADAIEKLHEDGRDRSVVRYGQSWMTPVTVAAASATHSGVGRWLMLDIRGDETDSHRDRKLQIVQARVAAKTGRQQAKAQRRARRARRDAFLRRGKEVKSALLSARYRTAMALHRALALAGFDRGHSGHGKDD
jgi:glycosyltransferase involved in cell wall biosynthesis